MEDGKWVTLQTIRVIRLIRGPFLLRLAA